MFAEIRAILNDVPLGKYRMQVGLRLRKAMFVNGVLFNSEVWSKLSATDLTMLATVDHKLMHFICDSHAKTPTEFVYLETAELPLRYIISSRRLMYLHNILQRPENELVKRVYRAQLKSPSKGDFVELILEDMKMINEMHNESVVASQSKANFKFFVKAKINEAAFEYLKKEQKEHKKTKHIEYTKFHIQPYIQSPMFTNQMVSLLFAMRSSMTRGIRMNFSSMYGGQMSCSLCKDSLDDQRHLLSCPVLLAHLTSVEEEIVRGADLDDIYKGVEEQRSICLILAELLRIRNELLERCLPVDKVTGHSISTVHKSIVVMNVK